MSYIQQDDTLITMLGGVDKSTQNKDISKAKRRAKSLEVQRVSRSIKVANLPEFDMASQLHNENDIAEYLSLVKLALHSLAVDLEYC